MAVSKDSLKKEREKTAKAFSDSIDATQVSDAFRVIIQEMLSERPEGREVFEYMARRLREIGVYRRDERLRQIHELLPDGGLGTTKAGDKKGKEEAAPEPDGKKGKKGGKDDAKGGDKKSPASGKAPTKPKAGSKGNSKSPSPAPQ